MGANCSNCNCGRDEREHELSIDDKGSQGQKVVLHEMENQENTNDKLNMPEIVINLESYLNVFRLEILSKAETTIKINHTLV